MRKPLVIAYLVLISFVGFMPKAHSQTSGFYVQRCCNATMTGYDTTNCAPGSGNTTGTSISCTLSIASTNHVLWVISAVGNGLSTGNIVSDTCASTQGAVNNGFENINGISGHFAIGTLLTTCTGSDTITVSSGPTPDYLYILVLDYNPHQAATFDSTGMNINTGSLSGTTDTTTSYGTHTVKQLVVAVHGWSGATSTVETLACGAGEIADYTNLDFFTISSGLNKKAFIICSQYQVSTGSFTSSATSNFAGGGWTNAMAAFTATQIQSRNHAYAF